MPANKEFMEKVMAKLAPPGEVKARAMFGGYGIFYEGNMFALISGTGLFFKADASNIADYQRAGSKQYKPMPYYQVPEAILEDAVKLLEWARKSMAIAPAKKNK